MEHEKTPWERIPAPIDTEQDRRQLCAILSAAGLEVRVVKEKLTSRGSAKRFVEYRSGE